MHPIIMAMFGARPPRLGIVLPVSLALSSSDEPSATVLARLYIDNDGGIRRFTESAGSGNTADYTTWHEEHPSAGVGDEVYVKVTHLTGTNRYVTGDGLAAYDLLTSNRYWEFRNSSGSPTVDVSTYRVDFSTDAVTADIGSVTLTVTLTTESP